MDSFVCENPIILQDAAQFGLKAWIIPTFLLILGSLSLLVVLKRPQFVGTSAVSKHPWLGVIIGVLIFLIMGHLILQDQAYKESVLESGNYRTYEGQVTRIKPGPANRSMGLVFDHIDIHIKGRIISGKGKEFKLPGNTPDSIVRTKNALIGVGGRSCFSRTCGLEFGDKVRIKKNRNMQDTLRIEKCSG